MTHAERPWMCEKCGYTMDRYGEARGGPQQAKLGDLSICLQCGHVYVRAMHGWQGAKPADIAALSPDERTHLRRVQETRRRVMAEHPTTERGGRA